MQSTPPVRATNMLLPHRLQHAFFLVFMVTTIVKNYCKLYKYQFSKSAFERELICFFIVVAAVRCQVYFEV